MFYSYNYCSISKSIFIQAFSPPPRGAPVSPTLRFRIPPFEGITSPLRFALPPFEGGGRGDVPRRSGHLSFRAKRRISFLFPARFLTMFGMTKGGVQIIIHSGFQPSAEGVALFPNASHWAELMRPFRAVFQLLVVNGYFSGT